MVGKVLHAEHPKSVSSRRSEYVSGVADKTPAAKNTTSLFLTPRMSRCARRKRKDIEDLIVEALPDGVAVPALARYAPRKMAPRSCGAKSGRTRCVSRYVLTVQHGCCGDQHDRAPGKGITNIKAIAQSSLFSTA